MLHLVRINKGDKALQKDMKAHYSQPRGFVGRQILYAIFFDTIRYGSIGGGSATKFLPGRPKGIALNHIINNTFFHVEGPYPCRNFVQKCLQIYRKQVAIDWYLTYGDVCMLHETLVENHRQGACYIRDKWDLVGQTHGFTAKRVSGREANGYSGKRVWDTKNLRPKFVFIRYPI